MPAATWEPNAEIVRRYSAGDWVADIARDHGVSGMTVSNHARKAGIPRRRVSPRVCADGVCEVCGLAFTCPIRNQAKKYCSVGCRKIGTGKAITKGKLKPDGHLYTTASGYRIVRVPHGHVSATSGRRRRRFRAPEHILVVESALGRPLKRGEVAHHINGDKMDNRHENLLVCTRAYHARLHGEMSRRYQNEKFGRVA